MLGPHADGAPGVQNLSGFPGEGRDQPQDHHQQQGKGRQEASKKGREFIAGQHLAVAAEPDEHDKKNAPQRQSVAQRLQRIGLPHAQKENMLAPMIQEGVQQRCQNRQRKHGQHPQKSLSPKQDAGIQRSAQNACQNIRGMLEHHPAANGSHKIGKAHSRMAPGKRVTLHGTLLLSEWKNMG